MLTTIFGKKKLTEDKIANVFVNTLLNVIDNSFNEVASNISNDSEFINPPIIDHLDSDKFLMIVLAGNLKFLSKYFSNTEEMILRKKIIEKFANVYGMEYEEMNAIVKNFNSFITRVNHPSKNIIYGMSKAVFYKYNLGKYQIEYFAQLNAPSPIFLKRMDQIMENYIWDWNNFFNKYKISPSEH